jgi:hypothetical protein
MIGKLDRIDRRESNNLSISILDFGMEREHEDKYNRTNQKDSE